MVIYLFYSKRGKNNGQRNIYLLCMAPAFFKFPHDRVIRHMLLDGTYWGKGIEQNTSAEPKTGKQRKVVGLALPRFVEELLYVILAAQRRWSYFRVLQNETILKIELDNCAFIFLNQTPTKATTKMLWVTYTAIQNYKFHILHFISHKFDKIKKKFQLLFVFFSLALLA